MKRNKKLNILIFVWRDIKHPQMGGSEVFIHQIAKRLAKKHNVSIFTSKPKGLPEAERIDNVKIIRKGSFLTVYIYAFLYYFFNLRNSVDFIIDVENGIPFFTPLFSRKPKLMVLHHIHNGQWFKEFILPAALAGFLTEKVLMPLVYKNIPVIAVSLSTKKELKSLGFKKIYLVYNAINPPKDIKAKKSKDPLLLYLGRIKAYKQIEIAIKVFQSLKRKNKNLRFYIAGVGDYEQKLKNLVRRENIKNVKFLGYVSERDKWKLMKEAWVFLMPSMKEGWGITIIEAAFCGTPAVGFNVPGVCDSIKNNKTGLLAKNTIDYKNVTKLLLENKKLRNKMGKNAKQWACNFSWDKSAGEFENIIEETIGSYLPLPRLLISTNAPKARRSVTTEIITPA